MRMRVKPAAGRDTIIVPDTQRPNTHAVRIMIIGKAKMVAAVQPVIIESALPIERIDVDGHRYFRRMLAISFN
jgi:hypothetical protein